MNVLLVAAMLAGAPARAQATDPANEAAMWKELVMRQARAPAAEDRAACQTCAQLQDFLEPCHGVKIDDLSGGAPKHGSCEGSCQAESTTPFDKIVLRRREDAPCAAAMADEQNLAQTAAAFGMPQPKDAAASCAKCTAAADWPKTRAALMKLYRALDDAFGLIDAKQRTPALAAAAADARAHETCADPASPSPETCRFKP